MLELDGAALHIRIKGPMKLEMVIKIQLQLTYANNIIRLDEKLRGMELIVKEDRINIYKSPSFTSPAGGNVIRAVFYVEITFSF